MRIFGHTTLVGRAKAAGFDGLYTYDVVTWNGALFRRLCAQAHAAGLLCAPSVGPGYDARLATRHEVVRPRNDGRRTTGCGRRRSAPEPTSSRSRATTSGRRARRSSLPASRSASPSYDGAWGKSRRRGAAGVPRRDCGVDGAPRRRSALSRARSRACGDTRPSPDRPARGRGTRRVRARVASRARSGDASAIASRIELERTLVVVRLERLEHVRVARRSRVAPRRQRRRAAERGARRGTTTTAVGRQRADELRHDAPVPKRLDGRDALHPDTSPRGQGWRPRRPSRGRPSPSRAPICSSSTGVSA